MYSSALIKFIGALVRLDMRPLNGRTNLARAPGKSEGIMLSRKFSFFLTSSFLVLFLALFLAACGRENMLPRITPGGPVPPESTLFQETEHIARHGMDSFITSMAWGWCFLFSLSLSWLVFMAIPGFLAGGSEARIEGFFILGLGLLFALTPAIAFDLGPTMVWQIALCTILPGTWLLFSNSEKGKMLIGVPCVTFFVIQWYHFLRWIKYNPWQLLGVVMVLVVFVWLFRTLWRGKG